jgi:integrase/recombinase XerC
MNSIKDEIKSQIDDFLSYLQNIKNYSPLTIKTYQKPILDMLELSDIYQENEVVFVNIIKYRTSIKDNKAKTIAKKISSIKSFINFLQDNGYKIKLKGANSIKTPHTLPKPIETKYIFEALDENSEIEQKLIVLLLYSFGLRISELASLKLSDIKEDWISVIGKGNKQRQIPTNKEVISLFKRYIEVFCPKEYIFERGDKPYSARQLQYRVEKLFKSIGIKVTPHQLRHSFATDLLNNGARINDVSELLGHSSLNATGIYTKLATTTKMKHYQKAHPLTRN